MAYSNKYPTVLDHIEAEKGTAVKYLVVVLMVVSMLVGVVLGFALAAFLFFY